MICRHCEKERYIKARGLCNVCYADRAVRQMYKSQRPAWSRDEPTEEQLDALIAERMQNLPKWWHISEKRGNQPDGWGRKNRTD